MRKKEPAFRRPQRGANPYALAENHKQTTSNPPQAQGFTASPVSACTNACTAIGNGGEQTNASSADRGFTAALTMIASLPLSDAEKVEAVRRLLAEPTHDERQSTSDPE